MNLHVYELIWLQCQVWTSVSTDCKQAEELFWCEGEFRVSVKNMFLYRLRRLSPAFRFVICAPLDNIPSHLESRLQQTTSRGSSTRCTAYLGALGSILNTVKTRKRSYPAFQHRKNILYSTQWGRKKPNQTHSRSELPSAIWSQLF